MKQQKKEERKEKGKETDKGKVHLSEEVLDITDDDEYGGESAGRLVWESYEQALKIWERETSPTERDRERVKIDEREKQAQASKPTAPDTEDHRIYY